MTNEELKNKIVDIARISFKKCSEFPTCTGCEYFGKSKYCLYENIADALIAAGIGDVKDLQAQVDVLEITNIALQAGYDDAEKDRLYWVDKYKEAEHRAEVAEKAGRIIQRDMARVFDISNPRVCELIANIWDLAKKQAEKELAEEWKDE